MVDKTNATLTIAIIALIASMGIPVTENIFSNELKDYYVCRATADIQKFKGGISGSGLTGYPYADSRAGYSRCYASDGTASEYVQIGAYAAEKGIDPYDLLPTQEENQPRDISQNNLATKKINCTITECKPI